MNSKLLLVVFLLITVRAVAQSGHIVDSGTYVLHTFENPVGREVYHGQLDSGKLTFFTSFKIRARGTNQTIDAALTFSKTFEPLEYHSENNDGNTTLRDTITTVGLIAQVRTKDTCLNIKTGKNYSSLRGMHR